MGVRSAVVVAGLMLGCGGEVEAPPPGKPRIDVTVTRPEPPAAPAPVACPPAAVPEGVPLHEGLVDVDRDVRPDRVVAWRADDGWHLVVDVKGKGALVATPDPSLDELRPAGGADVGGTRELELFGQVGEQGGVPRLGAWTRQGCALVRLTRDGAPAVFPLGEAPPVRHALACSGKGLRLVEREVVTGGTRVRTTALALDGVTLSEAATSDEVLPDGQPERRRERCGSVHAPEAP